MKCLSISHILSGVSVVIHLPYKELWMNYNWFLVSKKDTWETQHTTKHNTVRTVHTSQIAQLLQNQLHLISTYANCE